MRVVWCTQAAAAATCLLVVLAISQLGPVDGKGGGGGGSSSGKSSSYSSSSSSYSSSSSSYSSSSPSYSSSSSSYSSSSSGGKSSSYTSSMSSSQQQSAISTAGGTGRTSWGGGKSGNRWTFGGSTTKGGSTLYRGNNGRAYSSRPHYYGNGAHASSSYQAMSYTKKAIMWGAVAGVGAFAFYQYSSSRRDCDSYFFAYGSGCRSCSDWECPIGQYRSQCTPYADSYCKRCTNAPSSYEYTTPGNCCSDGGGCEYNSVSPFDESSEFPSSDPATLQIIFEVPTDQDSFNSKAAQFRQTLANVAGVPDDAVMIEGIESKPMSSMGSCGDSKCSTYVSIPTGSLGSSTSSPVASSPSPSPPPGDTGSGATSGTCIRASTADSTCAADCENSDGCCSTDKLDTCGFYRYNDCCGDSGKRRNAVGGCMSIPSNTDSFSVVSVAVDTSVGNVDSTWDKLNEYDVNKAMARACLWPAVMTYDNVDPRYSDAVTIQRGWVYTAAALSFVLLLGTF